MVYETSTGLNETIEKIQRCMKKEYSLYKHGCVNKAPLFTIFILIQRNLVQLQPINNSWKDKRRNIVSECKFILNLWYSEILKMDTIT